MKRNDTIHRIMYNTDPIQHHEKQSTVVVVSIAAATVIAAAVAGGAVVALNSPHKRLICNGTSNNAQVFNKEKKTRILSPSTLKTMSFSVKRQKAVNIGETHYKR